MLFLAMTQIANGAGREASMGGGGPYIQLLPNCADTSPASITVIGGNWPTNETVDLFWFIPPSTYQYLTSINAPHAGSFSINMSRPVVSGTTYLVRASSASVALGTVEASFTVPCGGATITDTVHTDIYASRYTDGRVSLSHQAVFGPSICTAYGDPFSPFNSPFRPAGYPSGAYTYQYRIRIPADYADDAVRVEIFDPDSFNSATNNATIQRTAAAQNPGGLPAITNGSCSSSNRQNPCLIPTGEEILVGSNGFTVDNLNLFWFMRVDENRGAGTAPGNGACGVPSSYDEGYNTETRYQLHYQADDGNGDSQRIDLARYKGTRDNSHDTDLRWVSPGSPLAFDQTVPVPVEPGSPQPSFTVDLTADVPNIVTDPDTGDRYIYLDISAVYGSSENGFEIWAGPPGLEAFVPSSVNPRNLDIFNVPGIHSSQGIEVLAMDNLPQNTNIGNRFDSPLLYIGPEYAGQTIFLSSFDMDSGAAPPIDFYFDTIAQGDWQYSFPHHTQPQPDGVTNRNCSPGSCNDQFVTPPYAITIPGDLANCDWLNPNPDDCTPFGGGRLMVSYDGGAGDTYTWQVTLPEAPSANPSLGCAAFPIAVHEGARSLTPTGTGSNPYPASGEFDYPLSPPVYAQFFQNVPDVPLANAEEGYVFKPVVGTGVGNMSWLRWNEGIANTANTLADSLMWPGNTLDYADHGDGGVVLPGFSHVVRGFVEAGDMTDTSLHIGDWITSSTGSISASAVRNQVEQHIDNGRVLRLPVWDAVDNGRYHITGFANFRAHGYHLNQGPNNAWLLLEFVNWDTSCGQPGPDLTIGQLTLATQPPIIGWQPVSFTAVITNTGTVDVNGLFFVDLFLDPGIPVPTGTISIPLNLSDGLTAVPSLAAGASRVVTLTAPLGFENFPMTHTVYAMVDSVEQIGEEVESNNITGGILDEIPQMVGGDDLLAIYALAYDNPPTSTKNLSLYYDATIQALAAGSVGAEGKTAVVLADLDDEGDTHILLIHNGTVQTINGLPDENGNLNQAISEYNMADGAMLGGFLQWARQQYPADKTIFSFIGHGAPLAPDTDLSQVFTNTAPTGGSSHSPTHVGANTEFTDYHSQSIISPYALAFALDAATNGGQDPIDVLDLVHCFALSVEEAHELAPYARTMTGTPHYAYFDPLMPGQMLQTITSTLSVHNLADTIIQTYNEVLPPVLHPRILVALDSGDVTAVKDAWDRTAYYLLQSYQQAPALTQSRITNAYLHSAKYDTSYCEVNWDLSAPDALSDMASFAAQLVVEFGAGSEVGMWADVTKQRVEAAVINKYILNGQPWFDQEPPYASWNFTGAGLALYTDFQQVSIDGNAYLN
jgi:hypothetical protein